MAVYPLAVWRPLPENNTAPRIRPRVAILHSAAVAVSSLHDAFNRAGNDLESQFFVKKTGRVEQYLDTTRQADANRFANPFAVAIETEDNGRPDTDPWTPPQLDAIDSLLRWLNQTHPEIVLERCKAWDGSGVGYHTMWGAPSRWTPVAKTCPGRVRVDQFNNLIVPRLAGGAIHQEDDMTPDQEALLKDIHAKVSGIYGFAVNTENQEWPRLGRVEATLGEVRALIAQLDGGALSPDATVDAIAAAVADVMSKRLSA